MTVKVLFFSTLRTLTGRESLDKTFAEPSPDLTVGHLLSELYKEYPALVNWDAQLLIGVDLAYASKETLLRDGQEIALMPPVQGG